MAVRDQSTRITLENVYAQWLCSHYQLEFVTRSVVMPDGVVRARKEYMSAYNTRELLSILERWHISTLTSDGGSTDKMQLELVSKGFAIDANHAQLIVANIVGVCERIDKVEYDTSGSAPYVMIDACRRGATTRRTRDTESDIGFVYFARFARKFSPARLTMMAAMAALHLIGDARATNDMRVVECITTAALCYDATVPRGQQLSIPPRAYDVMIQEYGATFEGFASPFNSQMLRYMLPGTQGRALRAYCSIFPRIDAPFGSVGSFFDESPATELCNRVSVLNPPFIESIILSMVKKCIADLTRATDPTRIFVIVPNWTDSQYFPLLTTCQYVERQIALPYNHYYVDAMRADLPVPMRIGQFLFVLSRNYHDTREHMYEDIIEAFQSAN